MHLMPKLCSSYVVCLNKRFMVDLHILVINVFIGYLVVRFICFNMSVQTLIWWSWIGQPHIIASDVFTGNSRVR